MIDFDKIDELVAKRQNGLSQSSNHNHITTDDDDHHQQQQQQKQQHQQQQQQQQQQEQEQGPHFINCTRYQIWTIQDDVNSFTKILGVVLCTPKQKNLNPNYPNNHDDDNDDNLEFNSLDPKPHPELHKIDGHVHLYDEWYHTNCIVGDSIHICSISGKYNTDVSALPLHLKTISSVCRKDDLVLILHPDELITPTSISDAVSCSRRAVIKTRLGSKAMTCEFCTFAFGLVCVAWYICYASLLV